uniref:Uncharacterized protein LOC114346166 n=1 Tax=Diabrotica virgifera virgifera TaxID=50390 RepID=A0A6P7H2M3_DIAVI
MGIINMDTQSNCILNEYYDRTTNTTCNIIEYMIKEASWLKMSTPNLWLVIPPYAINLAIMCDGSRSEHIINQTSFIKLSPKCVAQTRNITLLTSSNGLETAIGSYLKTPVSPIEELMQRPLMKQINIPRHNIDIRGDVLPNIVLEAEQFDQDISEHTWKTIPNHQWIPHLTTGLVTIFIVMLIVIMWKVIRYIRNSKSKTLEKAPPRSVSLNELRFELDSLAES